jgi:hypothetical protein
MATRQTTTKVRKKETVVPFKDELNFVVPKRGGFGQPDNEHYVMVAGTNTIGNEPSPTDTTQIGMGIPNTTIGTNLDTTTSTSSPIQQAPTPIVTPPPTTTTPPSTTTQTNTNVATLVDVPCTSFTYGSWQTCVNGVQTRTYVGVPSGCIDVPPTSQTQQNCTTNPNATDTLIDTIPTFPNWDTLDCTTLDAQITSLANTLAMGSFTQRVVDAYNTQLALARNIRNTKCPIKDNTTTAIIVPTTDTSGGGGGGIGGGGGGGGLGEPPSDESGTSTEETTSTTNNKKTFFILLGIVGLLYLLTRKK